MHTRYQITTAQGDTHTGFVQGSGGLMKGNDGLKRLRLAADGRPVNVFDPTSKPPYTTGRQVITHVAVFADSETKDYATVCITDATVEAEG
jgi:hypothetical protein